jgi:hypothetical protein
MSKYSPEEIARWERNQRHWAGVKKRTDEWKAKNPAAAAKLAAEKKAIRDTHKEEVQQGEPMQQIDELSKSTLKSYIKKSAKDVGTSSGLGSFMASKAFNAKQGITGNPHKSEEWYERSAEHDKRAAKRMHGIRQATDKLEESEQLEEMSTRKDFQQVADVIKAHPDPKKRQELAVHHAAIFKAQNPRFDHKRFFAAANATLSEEVEQLDELSRKTLKSYVTKASNDMYKAGHRTGYLRGTRDKLPTDVKDINKLNRRSDKRATGISRAVQHIAPFLEETEQQGAIMNEDFAPISDLITLVANEQHAEATPIIHDLLGARVLDAMQGFKQEIAQSLFAPLQEEAEQIDEISKELAARSIAKRIKLGQAGKVSGDTARRYAAKYNQGRTPRSQDDHYSEEVQHLEEVEQLDEKQKKEFEKSGKKNAYLTKSGKFSYKKFSLDRRKHPEKFVAGV